MESPTRTSDTARGIAALRWLAVFLLPFLALVAMHWNWPPPASAGDYAQYLLHARALVEGRPYTETGYIYDPSASLIGPPAYPPGLPLTLTPFVALGGVHSSLVRLLMPLSVLVFAVLAAWRLAREVEPWQAALGGAFAAYAIEASLGTLVPLSDPGFAALMWAAILVVDSDGTWSWRRVAAITALGFATLSYRTAGIALIPALLLYALLQRKRLGALPLVPALVWTAAGAVAVLGGYVRVPFTDRMLRSMGNLGEHLDTFVRQYRIAFADAQLYPFQSAAANDVYHLVATAFALLGLALIAFRARRTFLVALAAAYGALLLIAPVAEPRYAWALYPLVGAALAHGGATAVRRFAGRLPARTQMLLAMLPLVAVLLTAFAVDARQAPPVSLVRHPDARTLFAWLAQQRANDAQPWRVAYINPRVLTLETRVAAMGLVPRTPPGMLTALTRSRATHLVWQGVGLGPAASPGRPSCVQRTANTLPDRYPGSFTLEYRNPTFRVYRFHPIPDAANDPGEPISWSDC